MASLAVHSIGYLDPHFVRPYTLRSAHAYEVYGWLSFANKGPMYGQATTSYILIYFGNSGTLFHWFQWFYLRFKSDGLNGNGGTLKW